MRSAQYQALSECELLKYETQVIQTSHIHKKQAVFMKCEPHGRADTT